MANTKTKICVAFLVVILARIGYIIWLFSALDIKDKFEFDDKHCDLGGKDIGMIGSEDMALGKHGILFITSGDLERTFGYGATEANTGNIFIMNIKDEIPKDMSKLQLVKANIHSSPFGRKGFRFQPHGIDVSNSTDRVYVVNHNNGYSSVIVFDIKYNLKCLNDENCSFQNWASLVFKAEIRSDLFPLMALNDVVEASPSEFYVTQWLPYPYPRRGKNQPETIREYAELAANHHLTVAIFNYKWTTIFHCHWDTNNKPVCKVATQERFLCANGVTISPDGNTVYVNDVLDMNIMALSRNVETGELIKRFDIKLPSAVDNIEYDDEANEIILGNVIPGGMAIASPPSVKKGSDKDDQWTIKGVLKHNENKLKQISAAARIGNSKIVLGSPFSEGILVCSN